MLELVSNDRPLHIGTTYKIIRQPVSVVGITDAADVFKPVGVAITIKDTLEDYELIFKSMKENIAQDYKPKFLVSVAEIVFGRGLLNFCGLSGH